LFCIGGAAIDLHRVFTKNKEENLNNVFFDTPISLWKKTLSGIRKFPYYLCLKYNFFIPVTQLRKLVELQQDLVKIHGSEKDKFQFYETTYMHEASVTSFAYSNIHQVYLFVTTSSQISTECSLGSGSRDDHLFNSDFVDKVVEKLPERF
jgi:hypothetical protein